jgi:kinesin family member 23
MSRKQKVRVDPVEVFCRVRPLTDPENESCLKILDDYNLMLQIPQTSSAYRTGQIKQLVYSFSQIFDETVNQKQLFEHVGLPLVQDLLSGKNGLLFTYGVTGSGKTYSMIGNQNELGLLQRSLDTLFNSISYQQAKKYIFKPDKMNSFEIQTETDASLERQQKRDYFTNLNSRKIQSNMDKLSDPNGKLVTVNEDNIFGVFVSCIEIYNNYIYDLLDDFGQQNNNNNLLPASSIEFLNQLPGTSSNSNNNNQNNNKRLITNDLKESKQLKEDMKGGMYIKDVNEIEVKSTEEALELMLRAQKKRVVASTDLNSESSRSHSIFTIRVVQSSYDPSKNDDMNVHLKNKSNIHVSQLSLVDLAGSERTKRTKNTGSRLKEAGSINSSLMALRNCMEALRENITNGTKKMVPYRDSKLTLLFKNYFEGNGKIKMILCINPSSIEFDETLNVLKFSDLVKDILVPASNEPIKQNKDMALQNIGNLEKVSIDALEQANLVLLANLQQNNYSIMNENFPPLDVFSSDDEITLRHLIQYLEEFQRRRDAILHETDSLKQIFYIKLREMNDEYDKLKDERNEYKNRLDQRERDQVRSESKIRALEKIINTNGGGGIRTPMHQSTRPPQFATPVISSSTNSNASSSTNNSNNETPITSTFRSSRIMQTTTTTIGRTVGFTGANNNIVAQQPPLPPSQTPSSSGVSSRITSITNSAANSNSQKFQTPSRNTVNQQYLRHIQQQQSALKDGIPVGNKRGYSRRSKSAEMWLDHRPNTVAKIDTVMQPKMERKKSVSRIELSDAKKSTKYVLTHQQQDEDGEVVTNLIKGKIIQSPSGGANVIFTDVETLQVKQQEPAKPLRKRPSEEVVIDDKLTIEDRCAVAIEGHMSSSTKQPNKIIKKTKY